MEETTISILPVPQMLPELLSSPKNESKEPTAVGMLLVGDVHAKGDAGAPKQTALARSAARTGEQRLSIGDMPETRDEIISIQRLFDNAFSREGFSLKLLGDQPTEQAFRDYAPKADYIHLAVHGFFDPTRQKTDRAFIDNAELKSKAAPANMHPDLYCGLAFVGAGAPPQPNRDDGILTALELQAIDLTRAKLITMCSCQTGLGLQATGEGVIGIQRAFQVAGAQSTLTSLWSVPVGPTDALIVDFYDNLWKKKMSRAESLRQAQIKMLRHGGEHVAKWSHKPELASKPAPPYFWAAFVMAGDWRDAN
jgi:CHAT domain-containing protein